MNRWQEVFCNIYYEGKVPTSKIGKEEYDLLGEMSGAPVAKVSVRIPGKALEVYRITEYDCDMPKGKISVSVLASNLRFWKFRGWEVKSVGYNN